MSEAGKTLTVDGKEYPVESLSDNAKAQVANIRVVDEEIKKIEQHLAVYKTARAAYARVLQGELNKAEQPH